MSVKWHFEGEVQRRKSDKIVYVTQAPERFPTLLGRSNM